MIHATELLHDHRFGATVEHALLGILEPTGLAHSVEIVFRLPRGYRDPLIRISPPSLKRKIASFLIPMVGIGAQEIQRKQKFLPTSRIDRKARDKTVVRTNPRGHGALLFLCVFRFLLY
ncbi:hypothetical protein D3C76_1239530 [compost metagenome]